MLLPDTSKLPRYLMEIQASGGWEQQTGDLTLLLCCEGGEAGGVRPRPNSLAKASSSPFHFCQPRCPRRAPAKASILPECSYSSLCGSAATEN